MVKVNVWLDVEKGIDRMDELNKMLCKEIPVMRFGDDNNAVSAAKKVDMVKNAKVLNAVNDKNFKSR